MNSQKVMIKIIAPDTHQLLRSLRAIESLNPVYIEGKIIPNDKDSGLHCFLTLPVNWFTVHEKQLIQQDENKYLCLESNSQEQPQALTSNLENAPCEVLIHEQPN